MQKYTADARKLARGDPVVAEATLPSAYEMRIALKPKFPSDLVLREKKPSTKRAVQLNSFFYIIHRVYASR